MHVDDMPRYELAGSDVPEIFSRIAMLSGARAEAPGSQEAASSPSRTVSQTTSGRAKVLPKIDTQTERFEETRKEAAGPQAESSYPPRTTSRDTSDRETPKPSIPSSNPRAN